MVKKMKNDASKTSKKEFKDKNISEDIEKKIPNIDELKTEYDIIDEHLSPNTVLRKMSEKIEDYIKILIQLLQPEEFHSLHECAIFDDSDKSKIFDLYKNLMITHREALKSEILNQESNTLATIKYVHSELKSLKPKMFDIVQKMQDSWKQTDTIGKVRYFG